MENGLTWVFFHHLDEPRFPHSPSTSPSSQEPRRVLRRQLTSHILSYLTETDGTSALITCRRLSRLVLPLFVVPPHVAIQHQAKNANNGKKANEDDGRKQQQEISGENGNRRRLRPLRHCFMTAPAQDPHVLLDRLNTRRIHRRRLRTRGDALNVEKDSNGDSSSSCCCRFDGKATDKGVGVSATRFRPPRYRLNLSTRELALYEHYHAGLLRFQDNNNNKSNNPQALYTCNNCRCCQSYHHYLKHNLPPELELLRFKSHPHERLPINGNIETTTTITTTTTPTNKQNTIKLTLLASYPRSGNSLLRSLLERLTGILTGSDTHPDRPLSIRLAAHHDVVGEGVTSTPTSFPTLPSRPSKSKSNTNTRDANTNTNTNTKLYQEPYHLHLVKTHHPERLGWHQRLPAHAILLLVRNPYDAIDSYFNMACTNTHNQTVTESIYQEFKDLFEGMAVSEMGVWSRFHGYWLDKAGVKVGLDGAENGKKAEKEEKKVPMLMIRYEDLVQDVEFVMGQVVGFLLHVQHGSWNAHKADEEEDDGLVLPVPRFWRDRIRHVLRGKDGKCSKQSTGGKNENDNQNQTENVGVVASLGSYQPRKKATLSTSSSTSLSNTKATTETTGTVQNLLLKTTSGTATQTKPMLPRSLAQDRYSLSLLQRMIQAAREVDGGAMLKLFGYDYGLLDHAAFNDAVNVQERETGLEESHGKEGGLRNLAALEESSVVDRKQDKKTSLTGLSSSLASMSLSALSQSKSQSFLRVYNCNIHPAHNDTRTLNSPTTPVVRINIGTEQVRSSTDPYGRNIRAWRLRHTEGDTKPLPTL